MLQWLQKNSFPPPVVIGEKNVSLIKYKNMPEMHIVSGLVGLQGAPHDKYIAVWVQMIFKRVICIINWKKRVMIILQLEVSIPLHTHTHIHMCVCACVCESYG